MNLLIPILLRHRSTQFTRTRKCYQVGGVNSCIQSLLTNIKVGNLLSELKVKIKWRLRLYSTISLESFKVGTHVYYNASHNSSVGATLLSQSILCPKGVQYDVARNGLQSGKIADFQLQFQILYAEKCQ
jgi:hypothetical protein